MLWSRLQVFVSLGLIRTGGKANMLFPYRYYMGFAFKVIPQAWKAGCETDSLYTLNKLSWWQVSCTCNWRHDVWDNNTVYSNEIILKTNYLTFFCFACLFPSFIFLLFRLTRTSSESSEELEGESLKPVTK